MVSRRFLDDCLALRRYLNISWTFSLTHSHVVCCRGGLTVQLRKDSTRWKSLGTSNSVNSSGPSFSSTTSEPQVEDSVRLVPSACVISLVKVVVIFTGKPVSTPLRWTSILSILLKHLSFDPAETSAATTTPKLFFFCCRHSGITEPSMYQPSVSLTDGLEHAPGPATRFSRVMMCRAVCPKNSLRSPVSVFSMVIFNVPPESTMGRFCVKFDPRESVS